MKRSLLCVVALAISCSNDDAPSSTPCTAIQLDAYSGAVQADGSVVVYGSVGIASTDAGTALPELTVYSVDVAEVAAVGSSFNFETWSADVDAGHLAAFMGSGSSATLPVTAYLSGVCVRQTTAVVVLPAGSGSDAGSGSGS